MNRSIKTVLFFTLSLTIASAQSAEKEKKTTPTTSHQCPDNGHYHMFFIGSQNELEGLKDDIAMITALLHTFNARNQSANNNTTASDESKK